MSSPKKVLLSHYITPVNYKIFLSPDLDNFIFEGEEEITIKVSKPTNKIILHSAEIEVLSAQFLGKSQMRAKNISYNDRDETVTFMFPNIIPVGTGKLKLIFTGILNNKMRGFYRSRYTHEGKEYHMGVTQFESTDARRAFPCFDEPAQKATFDVSLKVPIDRTAISNTVETNITEHEGFKVVKFAPTPKMSSYLLAFIIGHFEFIEKITPEGVKVRVYVTPGKKSQAKFALDVAARVMSFYHKYFGIDYPLPSMDLIAIPDFANGAMENWGAVTYRETALLVDEENSSLHTKQWVALIIAHELAHQWFGNLVTMKWWTHLWLNEGFASFMEYLAVDKLFPEWNVWTQFIFTEQARAFSLDGLENTHPIEVPVHHPGEISEIFDAVSYSKGSSVIRMLESYIGEKNFQKGLQLYLRTHKYSNAETSDLWSALEKISGKPVEKIMKNWTSKPGYPIISIDKEKGKLYLSQERFYASPLANKKAGSWLVPISLISDDKKETTTTLIDKNRVELDGFSKSQWIKANVGDTSFARIKYSEELLLNLEEPIKNADLRLGEEGRFSLIRDSFALVEAGLIPANEALELLTAYRNEKSYIVWAEIVTHLMEFQKLLYGEDIHERFNQFGRDLLQEVGLHVGWYKMKNETHSQTLLRSSVMYALGALGDKNVINQAKKIFRESHAGQKIDSDLKSVVYALVAENGGIKEYEKFKEIYLGEASEEEKDRALRALSSFKDEELLSKTIETAFSGNVRAQDAFKAVYMMAGNPIGINLAWLYVKRNWEEIEKKFAGGHLFSRFVSPFSMFNSNKKADELENFFAKHNADGLTRTVAQTIEKIKSNAELKKRNLKNIDKFLKQ